MRIVRRSIVGILLAAYFGILLLPEWMPSVRATGVFFLYVLTLPFALLLLTAIGCSGAVGAIVSGIRNTPLRPRHRTMLGYSVFGLLLFGSAFGLSAAIQGELPSGSHLLPFDSATWKDPASSEPVDGYISIRQKMLGDVVTNVLPGRERRQLEEMLGPSADTTYFVSTGRDLIYPLGVERDSLFRIDSEWLLLWLDDSGRFERYRVLTD